MIKVNQKEFNRIGNKPNAKTGTWSLKCNRCEVGSNIGKKVQMVKDMHTLQNIGKTGTGWQIIWTLQDNIPVTQLG